MTFISGQQYRWESQSIQQKETFQGANVSPDGLTKVLQGIQCIHTVYIVSCLICLKHFQSHFFTCYCPLTSKKHLILFQTRSVLLEFLLVILKKIHVPRMCKHVGIVALYSGVHIVFNLLKPLYYKQCCLHPNDADKWVAISISCIRRKQYHQLYHQLHAL